jgi:hypothetical protein
VTSELHVWPGSGESPRRIDLAGPIPLGSRLSLVGGRALIAGPSSEVIWVDLDDATATHASVAGFVDEEHQRWSWLHGPNGRGDELLSVHVPSFTLFRSALPD